MVMLCSFQCFSVCVCVFFSFITLASFDIMLVHNQDEIKIRHKTSLQCLNSLEACLSNSDFL